MWCVCCFRPRRKKVVDVVEYDSDDERKYEKEAVPDPTQDDYYHDAVDDFHAQKDKVCAVNWHCGFQKWQCAFLKSSFFIFYKLKMMMWNLKQKLISKECLEILLALTMEALYENNAMNIFFSTAMHYTCYNLNNLNLQHQSFFSFI